MTQVTKPRTDTAPTLAISMARCDPLRRGSGPGRRPEANLSSTTAPHLRCPPWGSNTGEVWVEDVDDMGGGARRRFVTHAPAGVREDQQVIEALGSGCLQNDRIRSLLYAGKPN
jgi:hypothetical protein